MPNKRPDTTELIDGLNQDLANEYASIIQYRTYASMVRGPHRLTLKPMFESEIPDELRHAARLADAIAALGGTPTVRPVPVNTADSPEQMVQESLHAELGAISRYVERRQQAEHASEHGLAVDLDDIIADETRHRDELHLLLEQWESGARAHAQPSERAQREPARGRATADQRVAAQPR
ncbi:MAG TPA: ferritin-like domain-containing protein [Gemmatimonadaceae bacterium]|nr:ferritin-like domain-containing protein [Gemmatimonadaceae bacterium]